MKNWKFKIFFLLFAGVVFLTGQYFRGVWIENLPIDICLHSENIQSSSCNWQYFNSLGLPLITAGQLLAIVGVIVLFANELGFRRWWRVGRWYIPIAALLAFTIFPTSYLGVLPIDREWAVHAFGYLLILTTLVIVLWSWVFRNHDYLNPLS